MAAGIPTSFQIGAKVRPQTAAANYVQGASGKGTKWATNYLQAKVDPFDAAAAVADTTVANFVAAGASAIRAGLGRVNKAQVAKLIHDNGAQLYSQGVSQKGGPKYAVAATGLIPALQQAAANLPARGSLEQNIARSAAMIRAAKAMKGQHKG